MGIVPVVVAVLTMVEPLEVMVITSGAYGDSKYEPEFKCQKSHETKCYTVPRTVTSEYCEDREEKVCEKLAEKVPVPVERQNCHDENKKVCELEERSQPKQVKKYVYHKE